MRCNYHPTVRTLQGRYCKPCNCTSGAGLWLCKSLLIVHRQASGGKHLCTRRIYSFCDLRMRLEVCLQEHSSAQHIILSGSAVARRRSIRGRALGCSGM